MPEQTDFAGFQGCARFPERRAIEAAAERSSRVRGGRPLRLDENTGSAGAGMALPELDGKHRDGDSLRELKGTLQRWMELETQKRSGAQRAQRRADEPAERLPQAGLQMRIGRLIFERDSTSVQGVEIDAEQTVGTEGERP